MNHVFVVQVKSLRDAAEPYKRKASNNANDTTAVIAIEIFFLELNIARNFVLCDCIAVKLSGLFIKPLSLPIFKNLFFL